MKQLVSLLLSLLILLSSSGMTYAQHFCGEFEVLSKVTLGHEHLSCGMKMEAPGCDDKQKKEEDHNCCKNQYTSVDTDDEFSSVQFQFNFDPVFVAAFVSVFVLEEAPVLERARHFYSYYHPPPLIKDLPVLYETFLI